MSAPRISAQRLPLKSYTVADGLPNNVINKIVRDSRGFLWFCTGSGLFRFPASENFMRVEYAYPLAVYTTADGLAALQVLRLFEDSTGAVWVSTIGAPNGLARWKSPNAKLEDLANAPGLHE